MKKPWYWPSRSALADRVDAEPGFKGRAEPVGGDYYVAHRTRTQLARDNQADVFISIHADAWKTASASGASVFAISQRGATSETARWIAEKENRADLDWWCRQRESGRQG